MAAPAHFEVRDEADLIYVPLTGHLDRSAAKEMFGRIRDIVLAKRKPVGLLYHPTEPFSYEAGAAVEQAKALMKEIDAYVTRTAVVSEKTTVRFALSMIQLVTRSEIRSFAKVAEAKHWIRTAPAPRG